MNTLNLLWILPLTATIFYCIGAAMGKTTDEEIYIDGYRKGLKHGKQD